MLMIIQKYLQMSTILCISQLENEKNDCQFSMASAARNVTRIIAVLRSIHSLQFAETTVSLNYCNYFLIIMIVRPQKMAFLIVSVSISRAQSLHSQSLQSL